MAMAQVRATAGATLAGGAVLLSLGLAMPGPARAGLLPELRDGLLACLDTRRDFAARRDALVAAGWQPLDPADRLAAARAHAPMEVAAMHGAHWFGDLTPDEAAGDVADKIDFLLIWIDADTDADHWFTLPGGFGFGRITDFVGNRSGATCTVSGDIAVSDLKPVLDLPVALRESDNGALRISVIGGSGDPANPGPLLLHHEFTPDAIAGMAPLPIVTTTRVPYRPAATP